MMRATSLARPGFGVMSDSRMCGILASVSDYERRLAAWFAEHTKRLAWLPGVSSDAGRFMAARAGAFRVMVGVGAAEDGLLLRPVARWGEWRRLRGRSRSRGRCCRRRTNHVR